MWGRSWDDDDYPHHAAYVEAWAERRRTGRDDPSLLHDALVRRGVGEPATTADRTALDLLDEEWARGTSPRRLRWRLAARAGRVVWGTVASVVRTLRDTDGITPAWAAVPDDVLPMSDAARGWSVEDDRVLRVDEARREVLRRVVATTRPVFGSHLADVWLRVCTDSSAEVLVGADVVGTVELAGDDADRMRVAERHRVHADGALHVRSADDEAPAVQLWLPPHAPVHWPGLLAWLEEQDDEDD